jgi:hypothetical protein
MPDFAAPDFRSPSRSGGQDNQTCVDLACRDGVVELRDSKVEFGSPADHRIRLRYPEFDAFQRGVRTGRLDDLPVVVTRRADGRYELRADGRAEALVFHQAEIDAFYHDIHTGRYDLMRLRTHEPSGVSGSAKPSTRA